MQKTLQKALIASKGSFSENEITHIDCLSGGSFCNTWRLHLNDGSKLFAKSTTDESFPILDFEAKGLAALKQFADNNLLAIPEPLALVKSKGTAVMLMPWVNLGRGNQKALGEGLAMLHTLSTHKNPNSFGWEGDGYIGAGNQPGGWEDKWGKCFVNLRLLPQLRTARKWGLQVSEFEGLMSVITSYLDLHKPSPSLVHGDLWSGNCGIQPDGRGVLIDPATWWADREVDIAMTVLFGGFSNDFYTGYENIWPLEKSSEKRVDIYNLYHLLNHANIFGGSYKEQCLSKLKSLEVLLGE